MAVKNHIVTNPTDIQAGSHVRKDISPGVSALCGQNSEGRWAVQSVSTKFAGGDLWADACRQVGTAKDADLLANALYGAARRANLTRDELKEATVIGEDIILDPLGRVVWVDSFYDYSTEVFIRDVMRLNQESDDPIVVIINSPGGSAYGLLSMIDHINLIAAPVATIALGRAMSAGAFLLSCGVTGRRYVAENAQIMIHEIQSGVAGNAATIENDVEYMKRLNDRALGILAKNCGKTLEEVKSLFRGGRDKPGRPEVYLSASEAVDFGIADKILDKEAFKRLLGART